MYDNLRSRTGTLNSEKYLVKTSVNTTMNPGSQMLTVYSTGYNGNPDTILNNKVRAHLFDRLLEVSPAVLSVNAGGTSTFGNDTAINSIEAAVNAYTALGYKPPFMLLGHSMGYTDMMAWARTRPNDVCGVICMYGLVDLNAVYDNPIDLSGTMSNVAIDAAYGGTYDRTIYGPTHNARQFLGSMPFPTKAFYAPNDELLPTSNWLNAAAESPNFTAMEVAALGHSDATAADAADRLEFRQFIRECQARWKAANP